MPGDSTNSQDMSFAQAALKGLPKIPSAAPPSGLTSRQEEILRAIENHEGWGSRPIRQDTSWDTEGSPKSQRKFSAEGNATASNVWNNSNGTAIWEAVRENQSGNWGGGGTSGATWNPDKDHPSNWGPPKPGNDPSSWGANANDSKSYGTWGGAPGSGAGDASNKLWGGQSQKTDFGGSWGDSGNVQRPTTISSWGDDGDTWEDPRRITGSMQNMVPPSPGLNGPGGMMPQGMPGMAMGGGMGPDNTPWNDSQKSWTMGLGRAKIDEPWNKPPPKVSGWGDVGQDGMKVDDGTGIWASVKTQMPPQVKVAGGWGETGPQGQWNAVGTKPKAPGGWDEASWAMAQQRAKQMPPKANAPTQMRAKLLQHLMDMGFRKEEAQNALITNNMNLEMAINDLKNGGGGAGGMGRKDLEDMFQVNGGPNRMPYMSKGLEEADQVPNFTSAPFPGQPFPPTSMPPSSLGNQSLNPSLQHKLIQKMQQVPPNMNPRNQMPPVGSAPTTQVAQQQQQQQILAQLRQAVNNGYISQQLLNYQLPHNILVLLQQLLQLQTARQNMSTKLQQARLGPNRANQQQLENMITSINQQITNLRKQLQIAQNNLLSSQKQLPNMSQQPPSGLMTPVPGQQGAMVDNIDALSNDIVSVSLQNQSRLTTQWKPPGDAGDGIDEFEKNKGLNLIPGGLNMTRDHTWSTSSSSSSNWPTSSENTVASGGDKATTSSATASILSGMTDVIPEFVPGKPWQGLITKSVEDDPHVTPGSIQRSLSVNRVHDESLNNLDGSKLGAAPINNWSNKGDSLGLAQLGTRPPPVTNKGGQWQQGAAFNRQASWAGRSSASAFTQVGSNNWSDGPLTTTWVLLKNLNPSLDSATVRALCQQHGHIANFFSQGNAALVQFANKEVAMAALHRLNGFQIGNTVIMAELLNEAEAQRVVSQIPPPMTAPTSQWSQAPPSLYQGAPQRPSDPWAGSGRMGGGAGGSADPWGGTGLWDMNALGEHILGSESM